jgi:hypothetical protein
LITVMDSRQAALISHTGNGQDMLIYCLGSHRMGGAPFRGCQSNA